jgi:hypothetical protein
MKSAKNYFAVAGAFALAIVLFSIAAPRAVHAIVATLVQVTNTSANPVPTQPVGTTPVSGAVEVSNLPSVQAVAVTGNGSGSPLFVRDVDSGGRGAVSFYGANLLGPNVFSKVVNMYVVPPGKLLIVDQIATNANMPPGQRFSSIQFQTFHGGTLTYSFLNPPFQATGSGRDFYNSTQLAKAYADAGTTVAIGAQREDASGAAIIDVEVQGHLVDCANDGC